MILHNFFKTFTHKPQQKPHSHQRHAVPLESILFPLRLRQVLSPPLLHLRLPRLLPQLFSEPRRSGRLHTLLPGAHVRHAEDAEADGQHHGRHAKEHRDGVRHATIVDALPATMPLLRPALHLPEPAAVQHVLVIHDPLTVLVQAGLAPNVHAWTVHPTDWTPEYVGEDHRQVHPTSPGR